MDKKPKGLAEFLKDTPEGIPLIYRFQSACGQKGGKIEIENTGVFCSMRDGKKIKGVSLEGPG